MPRQKSSGKVSQRVNHSVELNVSCAHKGRVFPQPRDVASGRHAAPAVADDDEVSEYDGDEESRPITEDDEEEDDDDDDDDDEDYEEVS